MRPVKAKGADVVYRGPTDDVGDLWVERLQPGVVMATYEFDDVERQVIAEGGRVQIRIHSEPMPPIGLDVVTDADSGPVEENPYRIQQGPGRNGAG